MAKTVWILGAGFSRSLGAPLLADLFSEESLERVRLAYPTLEPDGRLPWVDEIVRLYLGGAYGLKHRPGVERQWEHAEEFIEKLELASRDPKGLEHDNFVAMSKRFNNGPRGINRTPHLFTDDPQALKIDAIHECALRLLAAECDVFRHGKEVSGERWDPYQTWAKSLGRHDTVLTFNYDIMLDLLSRSLPKEKAFWIPDPQDLLEAGGDKLDCPTVLKLHGSINWLREGRKFLRADRNKARPEPDSAGLYADKGAMAIATPGHSKRTMVTDPMGLQGLWDRAAVALREAKQVVFVGYRIPPTDSYTRQWLTQGLAGNDHIGIAMGPEVFTVLGDDVNHPHSRRLAGILKGTSESIKLTQPPMFAEDFLGVIGPEL
jgi:hypothetical protein